MAWTTPPTFAAATLTAAQMNILSEDIRYLYNQISGVNNPFVGMSENTADLRKNTNGWLVPHAATYLHWLITVVGATSNTDLDLFITKGSTDLMFFTDSSSRAQGYTYSAYANIEDITTWTTGTSPGSGDADIYQGGWVISTAYVLYDIVSHGGSPNYYYCKSGHTSAAGDEPGVGGSWTTYWTDLGTDVNLFATGSLYRMHVYSNTGNIMQVNYILESSGTTL